MKIKILHFIFNLGRGGAETMMVRVIKELPEYEHVVVTLFPLNHFGKELICDKFICLNLRSLFSLPISIFLFRRTVKKEIPDLVHTHLFWPTVIARLAVPRKTPLITTIHAFINSSVEYKNWHIRFIDKLTFLWRQTYLIVVANGALKEYLTFIKRKPIKAWVLYTFVDTVRFKAVPLSIYNPPETFRIVSVGALRTQKNYSFLIDAFSQLKDANIELHIYGEGDMHNILKQKIEQQGVRVILKGEVRDIENVLPEYHLYVLASTFEGFSLSVLEAMAMGMPLLLSDIASFREQCDEIATFFSLAIPEEFLIQLRALMAKPQNLMILGEKARQKAVTQFTLDKHIASLRGIYRETLGSK